MLWRLDDLNRAYEGPAPEGTRALEEEGHYVLRGALSPAEVTRLRDELLGLYARLPAEMRASAISPAVGEQYRYQLFNHSALCQETIARPEILALLEPLLGNDCHVIACTSWRNPPGRSITPHGLQWHTDGGPQVPLPSGVTWPQSIPFPIFVVAAHVYVQDVRLEDGPTACIPGSHRSGRIPPHERLLDPELECGGRRAEHHLVRAGDVDFRVSDVWHRRTPPSDASRGRLFLQVNYARRDIAQRLRPTTEVNHTSPEARARAGTERARRLIGLHPQSFFDA